MTSLPSVDPPRHHAPTGLSPSRAADFKTCPLLYRLRSIDRIPEPATKATSRGTLIHAVLERLYELPAAKRGPEIATRLIEPEWAKLLDVQPELTELFPAPGDFEEWLASAHELVRAYFSLEDPTRLAPAETESLVEVDLASGLRLRGIVDRLDISPAGDIRVVDYKSGASPRAAFEAKALFQLKFYALVILRTRGVVPKALRLVYLADRELLDYTPTESELRAFESTLNALWQAIQRSLERQEFTPNPSKLCDWCQHQRFCPEFGGQPPPFPKLETMADACEPAEAT